LWNSLPSLVVKAPSLNCFQTRLDKFWSNHDVLYHFKAPFLGTGSRSYSQSDCIVYSVTYIDVGIEATSLRPQCRYDTIRKHTLSHTLHTFKNTSKHTDLDSLNLKPPAPLHPLQDFKALYKYCIIIIIIIFLPSVNIIPRDDKIRSITKEKNKLSWHASPCLLIDEAVVE